MKIICIVHNYSETINENIRLISDDPLFFMKPDSSILTNNKPFYLPDFSEKIHYEAEIVLKINRLGKNIAEKYAYRYYNEIGVGIDFTAWDLYEKQSKNSFPWELAKTFDGSAPISKFIKIENLHNPESINFRLDINNNTVQQGNTKNMIFGFDRIISYISQFLTLKIGDLIFTGTPSNSGSLKMGDHLQAFIEGEQLLDFYVK